MRLMYDSVTASDIPANALMVAGYVNGAYKWSQADWDRFPHAVKVRIATRGNVNDGHVLDVELGAAKVGEAVDWVMMRRRAGINPSVYCSRALWQAIRGEFLARQVIEPWYWIAHYDHVRNIPTGAIAKQFIDPPQSGGHFDLSMVADYWPGVDEGNIVAEIEQIKDAVKTVLAGDWRFAPANRNPIDILRQTLANTENLALTLDNVERRLGVMEDKLDALVGGVTLRATGEIRIMADTPTE